MLWDTGSAPIRIKMIKMDTSGICLKISAKFNKDMICKGVRVEELYRRLTWCCAANDDAACMTVQQQVAKQVWQQPVTCTHMSD